MQINVILWLLYNLNFLVVVSYPSFVRAASILAQNKVAKLSFLGHIVVKVFFILYFFI